MSQETGQPGEGEPIAPLAELEQDVSPEFINSVRKKIFRRTATNQMVSFSWNLPKVILVELIMLVGHLFSSSRQDKV